ncbi:hypothetical protein HZA40_05080 [Candidatus Peregrinibacteria bacterium]|nr:hypothetical protein [Candidatus Peregrinibacteria bacterium]
MKLRQILAPALAFFTLLPLEARAENPTDAPRDQIREKLDKVIGCVRKKGFKFKGQGILVMDCR